VRIIAGEFRGRKLLAPKTDVTRPITDRAKQSLFDVLTPYIADARVYDCFAGTGSLGLEALSRGATMATFFERDRVGVRLLRENIDALGVSDRSKVIDTDIFSWFKSADGSRNTDLVFLDPPYRFLTERPDDVRELTEHIATKHLNEHGMVIFRHDLKDNLDLPGLARFDQRDYGDMAIELLRREV